MPDIADLVPQQSPTVEAIFAAYKKAGDAEQPRGYLGASSIGHPCERYLWYQFRFCCRPEFDGRMYRLFQTGHLEEARMVADLRAIGCEVHDYDANGEQFAVSAVGGHFSGHMDGCILGVPEAPKTWHVTEYKTHSAKSFAKLKKEGVKKSKPQHYAQMMAYMGLTKMTRALYLARNKDTDDLYAERIRFDKSEFDAIMAHADRIITTSTPPERIATRPDWFECQWCDAKTICWGTSTCSALPVPEINCRQCCHATPKMDGVARWECEKHKRSLAIVDQRKACPDHLCLPGLFRDATPFEYGKDANGKDYIFFRDDVWGEWKHGGTDGFKSWELMRMPSRELTGEMLKTARECFDAAIVSHSPDDILSRYPESDSRIVWTGTREQLPAEWQRRYREDIASLKVVSQCNEIEYQAAEFPGDRVVIAWKNAINCVEVRQGVE